MRKFVSVNGAVLNCAFDGPSNGIPLVFVNPLGTGLRIWDDVIESLSDRYPIIRYDKRGHGLSDGPPGPFFIHDHAKDLAALLDSLGMREVVLVGSSIGGMIALDFAAGHPQRVQALILGDTAAKIGTAEYWNERIGNIRQKGMAAMLEVILLRWFAADFQHKQPAAYQGYANLLARTDLEGYLTACAAIRDADLRDVLPGILCPTLVLCGAEDSATPPELVRGLADELQNSRFQLIPDAGHTPSVEHPEAMADAIIAFLGEIGRG
ncbi:MAG: 3-oxoadipate enol-lactonase [Chloroflexota bacterium]|nr:MAG: 3-oxoadipate enol-lactonase [Chloroflexota bacterium]